MADGTQLTASPGGTLDADPYAANLQIPGYSAVPDTPADSTANRPTTGLGAPLSIAGPYVATRLDADCRRAMLSIWGAGVPYILIVDDDEDTRIAIREVLIYDGFAVREAQDGSEAIGEILKPDAPHLVFVDPWMPKVGGTAFLDWAEQQPALAQIPIVVLSGDSGVFQHQRAAAVLRKPFTIESLLEIARTFCKPG